MPSRGGSHANGGRAPRRDAPGPPGPAAAQFPERPITLIAPFPAGGAVDIVARGLAEAVRKHLPKPVVVELVTLQVVLFVRADSPFRSAAELLEHARANPGRLRVGVPGIGTILHLDLELLKQLARVDLTVVPFEGPHQIPALLGGHVDVAMAHPAPVLPHVRAGKIRVIGVFQEERNPLFPEAPTFKELGYDVTLGVYYFLVAPRGTPAPVVGALHDAFRRALAEPAFVALAEKSQFDIDYRPGEEVKRELWASFERLGTLVRQLGLGRP